MIESIANLADKKGWRAICNRSTNVNEGSRVDLKIWASDCSTTAAQAIEKTFGVFQGKDAIHANRCNRNNLSSSCIGWVGSRTEHVIVAKQKKDGPIY